MIGNEHIEKIVSELSKLKEHDIQHVFYKLLRKKKIDLFELSKVYTKTIEEDNEEWCKKVLDSTTSLITYKDRLPTDKQKEEKLIAEYTANKAILNTGIVSDCEYGEELKARNKQIETEHPKLHIFRK